MNQEDVRQFWDGLRRVVESFRNAEYWTHRREATELLMKSARQAIYRLRQAAEDPDPDVNHWGRQHCAQIEKDLSTPLAELAPRLEAELAETAPPAESAAAADETATQLAPSGPLSPGDLVDWLEENLTGPNGSFERRDTGASFVLELSDGRCQRIYLDMTKTNSRGEPVALFYSICGQADPDTFRWAMEANTSLSRGAFGVIQHKDRDVLILRLRRSIADIRYETIQRNLRYLAGKADWAEARLKEDDVH